MTYIEGPGELDLHRSRSLELPCRPLMTMAATTIRVRTGGHWSTLGNIKVDSRSDGSHLRVSLGRVVNRRHIEM